MLSLAACSGNSNEPPDETTAVVDPRVASLGAVTSLSVAEGLCEDVPMDYTGEGADVARACSAKLAELMLREEMPSFDAGLRYFNRQLTEGKMATLKAAAAQAALTRWLRENAPKADDTTLWRWRNSLPEEDRLFIYATLRSIINDEIGN